MKLSRLLAHIVVSAAASGNRLPVFNPYRGNGTERGDGGAWWAKRSPAKRAKLRRRGCWVR